MPVGSRDPELGIWGPTGHIKMCGLRFTSGIPSSLASCDASSYLATLDLSSIKTTVLLVKTKLTTPVLTFPTPRPAQADPDVRAAVVLL